MKDSREAAIDLMFRAVLGGYRPDEKQIEDAINVLRANGFEIVPINPNEQQQDADVAAKLFREVAVAFLVRQAHYGAIPCAQIPILADQHEGAFRRMLYERLADR